VVEMEARRTPRSLCPSADVPRDAANVTQSDVAQQRIRRRVAISTLAVV